MKTNLDQFENDRLIDDPMSYKAGIFYFNRKDGRIVIQNVPELDDLKFCQFYTYLLILGIIAVFHLRLVKIDTV